MMTFNAKYSHPKKILKHFATQNNNYVQLVAIVMKLNARKLRNFERTTVLSFKKHCFTLIDKIVHKLNFLQLVL